MPYFDSFYCSKKNRHKLVNNVHWVPLTMSSVTTSTLLQQADFFASKSLTAMLKILGYNEYPLITSSFFCIFLLEYGIHNMRWLRLNQRNSLTLMKFFIWEVSKVYIFWFWYNDEWVSCSIFGWCSSPKCPWLTNDIYVKYYCVQLVILAVMTINLYFSVSLEWIVKDFVHLTCGRDPKYHGNVSCHDFHLLFVYSLWNMCVIYDCFLHVFLRNTWGSCACSSCPTKKAVMTHLLTYFEIHVHCTN